MNCESFCRWLENRDTHDISEEDRAAKHTEDCDKCRVLQEQDQLLDRTIGRAMAGEAMPESLRKGVDVSLDRAVPVRRKGGLLGAAAAACLVVALLFSLSLQQSFTSMDELGRYVLEDHLDHGGRPEVFEQVERDEVWLADMVGEDVHAPAHLPKGYRVAGARFCMLDGCRAAHIVYEKDGSPLSVFVIEEGEVGFDMKRGRTYSVDMTGSRVMFWKQDARVFALVG